MEHPSKLVLGVDPGASGALALIEVHDGGWDIRDIIDMPLVEVYGKPSLDATKIEPIAMHVSVAVLEVVNARPDQGVSSMFQFGRMYGAVEAALDLFVREIEYVTPQKWKKHFGLSGDKGEAIDLANLLLGDHAMWNRKGPRGGAVTGNSGCAEAALLAKWYIDNNE